MYSVSLKKMRDKWGLYFGLPGFPERRNYPLGLELNQKAAAKKWRTKVAGWIANEEWAALHNKFPDCERIRSFLPVGAGLTMDELFANMNKDWKDQNRRSIEDMEYKLKEVSAHFKGRRVCEVTTKVISDFLTGLRERGLSAASANRKLAMIQRAFNHGVERGLLKPGDLPGFPKPYGLPLPRQSRFTDAEIVRLVAELPERLKRVVRVASIIGWRLNEVLSRQWGHIEEKVLYLDAASSKNGEPRMFPLTAELRAVLKEQREWVSKLELELSREASAVIRIPWIFPNDDPRHKVGDRIKRIDRAFQRACEKAGLNVDANGKPIRRWFHDFRRYAQDRYEDTLNDTQIMEIVGHKMLSMRKRYRGNSSPGRVEQIGARLDRVQAGRVGAPNNVVDFVQPVCNTASDEADAVVGD